MFGKNPASQPWLPPFEYPFPFWAPNTSASQWITPFTNDTIPLTWLPSGNYAYHTTFILPDTFDPLTDEAGISGMWATDNNAIDILINGISTGNMLPVYNSFYFLHPFSITDDFKAGMNTLDFLINNDGPGASGIHIQMANGNPNQQSAIPEPTTMLLLGFGLMGLAGVRRKLKGMK